MVWSGVALSLTVRKWGERICEPAIHLRVGMAPMAGMASFWSVQAQWKPSGFVADEAGGDDEVLGDGAGGGEILGQQDGGIDC